MSEPHTIPPHEPLNSENDPTGRWRIAELEALVNANTDHMTEVGVELCRERDARIAALEAVLKQTTGQREYAATQRADKAEAHAADCKRLVTACEEDIDAERMKRREVEAELKSAKHLNAKWMDERTTALMDKEKAEAILLGEDVTVAAYRNMQAALAECKQERGELRKAIRTLGSDYNVLSAALAESEENHRQAMIAVGELSDARSEEGSE